VSKFVAKFRKNDYGDDYSSQEKKKRRKENKGIRKSEYFEYDNYSEFSGDNYRAKRKEKVMS
jgi:hypothetical protein